MSTPSIATAPSFVVGISASAGGLDAIERLFTAMPLDTGLAFVVVQHLSPDYKSVMDELMARFTRLEVIVVSAPVEIHANTVYLLPPGKEMVIEHERLVLVERQLDQPVPLPITRFFRSLAQAWGDRAIAIVLSGTGTDGSVGVRDVHAAGGLVLAQSEASAKFDGMPRAAVATGFVDQVLDPEAMPACLVRYARGSTAAAHGSSPALALVVPEQDPEALLARLRDRSGIDFNFYKRGTITRRLQRRMEFGQFRTMDAYCQHAVDDPAELDEVCRDLLIGMTRFFRDPEAFELLRDQIVPQVVASVPVDEDVRVWVSACATGEEAYSLAMLFLLELERCNRPPKLRVFASDVHRESLRIAGEGRYSDDALDSLPPALKAAFFVAETDGRFRIASRVRKRVLFSAHNILSDVPFNRIDLVSCRNLLIYFVPEVQTWALVSFYFALEARGVMILGPSESTGEFESYFEVVDRTWKIYRKVADARMPLDHKLRPPALVAAEPRAAPPALGDASLSRACDALLARFMPAGVLVNDRREPQYVFGGGNKYLRLPPGRVTADVVSMCEGDLRFAVASALAGAAKRRERVEVHHVAAGPPGTAPIDVIAEPCDDAAAGPRFFLLRFVEAPNEAVATPGEPHGFVVADDAAVRIRELEVESREARESSHALQAELESANEELQAGNEELIASNEELQSTNEELQSVNEELHTVNAQYNQKILDLAATDADLRNLMAASHSGIVFVDEQQHLRLFTPGATQILNLLAQDLGRPLAHITSRIADDDLGAALATVRATRATVEKTLRHPDGRYFLRRIQPYQDADGHPDGAVITFTDITDRKQAEVIEQKLQETAKLESLGILAGGIAHDFSNILTTILANVTLMGPAVADRTVAAAALADVQAATLRAADLCRQMLAFSGRGRFVVRRVALASLIRDTATLIRASLARSTTLDLRLDADVPAIDVDTAQIQQVLMNLIINASEALPAIGGTVRITTGLAHPGPLSGEVEIVPAQVLAAPHVSLEITDDGAGIEPSLLRRIFEPFYTTKFTGRGLGLAAVQGIVRGHHAALYVRSSLGQSTTFRLLIPVAADAVRVEPATAPLAGPEPRASVTILVVDDEDAVRRTLARILAVHGHHPVLAASGTEAVALVRAAPWRFRLALIDFTMPGLDGFETMTQIRQLVPGMEILIMSGYAGVDVTARFGATPPSSFLQKPLDATSLVNAVAAVLARSADQLGDGAAASLQ